MKIYVNARFLLQRPTGVERYAYEICKALIHAGTDITMICPSKGKFNDAYEISDMHIVRYGKGKSHLWEQLALPFFFIGKKKYIILSFTGLGSILIPHKIMTVHDLSFLENPSWFSRVYYHYYKFMTPIALYTSKHIITVSEFSKKEILKYYGFIKPEEISVIYNAADKKKFHSLAGKRTNDSLPYFLAVSSLDKRKNFANLLEAFKGIEHFNLKIVGGSNRVFSKTNTNLDTAKNIEFLGRVSDQELLTLYNNAYGFVFPSLYEGFGLPIIEAMSSECPVLASDIEVMREVCGDAAIFFDPKDVSCIHGALERFCKVSTEERQNLIQKGILNSKRFSWQNSARKVILTLNKYTA